MNAMPGCTIGRMAALCCALGAGAAAWAQAFPIVPPKLPARGTAMPAAGAPGAQGAARPQAPQGTYPTTSPQGTYPGPVAQAAYATPAPAPAAPAGPCRVLPSPERQALALVSGEPPLPREHLPLGEFRAQQVLHSPDGRWAVAFTKLRGAPQFAALTFDLERCRAQRTIDLPAAGRDAEFHGEHATLRYDGGQQRVALKDGSVR